MSERNVDSRHIKVYFHSKSAYLYEVGYILTDIFQLLVFSECISESNIVSEDDWFGVNKYALNRYASIFDKYRDMAQIVDAKKGSLELVVAVSSLLSSIIVPLSCVYLQDNLNNKDITFEVSVEDHKIHNILKKFANGEYGKGEDGLHKLFSVLRDNKYSVSIQNKDIYIIHNVLTRYSLRMVNTFKKP